jgi:uncharacterized membrane protein
MPDQHDIEPHAHHGASVKRDSLARTAPLFALLFVVLLVYGLAVLTGATTNHGVLIIALVLLVVATYGVVAGTVKMIELPPEDGDEEPVDGSAHGH